VRNEEMARKRQDLKKNESQMSLRTKFKLLCVGLKISLSCFPKHHWFLTRQYCIAPLMTTFLVGSLQTVSPGIQLGF